MKIIQAIAQCEVRILHSHSSQILSEASRTVTHTHSRCSQSIMQGHVHHFSVRENERPWGEPSNQGNMQLGALKACSQEPQSQQGGNGAERLQAAADAFVAVTQQPRDRGCSY